MIILKSFLKVSQLQGEARYRRKKLRNLTISSLIIWVSISLNVPISPNVPMSPNFSKIYILNYVVDIMNDAFSWLNFPNLLFPTFIWMHLIEYLILRIIVIHFILLWNCMRNVTSKKLFYSDEQFSEKMYLSGQKFTFLRLSTVF
jgi:hypothetical protein